MIGIDRDTFILVFILIIFVLALFTYNATATQNINRTELTQFIRKANITESNGLPEIATSPRNMTFVPSPLYVVDKDYQRIINPLEPPERSNPYRPHRFGMPINIPSRGLSSGYQQVGALIEDVSGDNRRIFPLFGELVYPGGNMWRYYTGSDNFPTVKLEVHYRNRDCMSDTGCEEIYEGQRCKVDGFDCEWIAKIYKLDRPRYNPYII